MKKELQYALWITTAVVGLVALDQALKLWIHAHFAIGESLPITSWFWICYIENDGMAFGIEWFSKLLLTLFRLGAIGLLIWYIVTLVQRVIKTPLKDETGFKRTGRMNGYIAMITMVAAGALGNIIDCVFYGIVFDYAPLFYGRVIDMLYFPLIRNAAGEVLFFRPVFNLADSYITTAVICILLFFRKELNETLSSTK